MKCANCGSINHTIKNCPETNDGWVNRMHMYCTYCGSGKHNIKACPKINGVITVRLNEQLHDHFIKD